MHVLIGLTAALLFAAAMSSCKGAVSQTDAAASADTSAQDKAAVAKAKAKLEIGYRSGDSKESVTQRLTLPQTVDGCPGITVTWASSEPKAVASDGTVTRSHADKKVTLTAILKKNAEADKKAFTVTVLKTNAAVQEAEKAKEKLEISYVSGDSKDAVTQDLTLPAAVSGFTDVSITWKSDKPETVKDDGTVIRPDLDTTVTLTATLEKNGEKTKKTFTVTVKGTAAEWIEEKLKNAGVQPLVISGTAAEVTLSGSEEVTWTSNQPAVIDVQGKHEGTCAVTKPTGTASVSVILTATVTKAGLKKEKSFTVVVYPENSTLDIDKLLTAIALPAETETDIPLPKTIDGIAETSITWQSDKADVLSIDTSDGKVTGKITRKEQDETVGLTATLSYKGAERQKTFTVTVRRDYDKAAVKNAFEKLGIGYTSGNSESSVTENLELLENIAGVSITWKSDKPETVKDDGTVIRSAETDIQVTLTATLTKGQATKQKIFTVTVLRDQDRADVKTAYNKLEIGYKTGDKSDKVTQNLTLPKTVAEAAGVSITWKSDKPETVKDDGTVIRPVEADIQVTLTATLTKGQATKQKTFTVTVLRDQDIADLESALKKLKIGYKNQWDNERLVRGDLILPDKVDGFTGVAVTWESNNTDIIKNDGKVTRPDLDTKVTLTATLKKNKAEIKKPFTVKVIGFAKEQVEDALSAATVTPLVIQKSHSLYQITLSGSSEPTLSALLTWTSSHPAVIDVKGKPSGTYPVTSPAKKTIVTLTAKAEKAGIAKEKNFTVTVFPENSNPSLDEWFDAAIPKEVTTDIDLPANYDGTSATAITWTSGNEQAIRIEESPHKAVIMRELRDVPVTLTAKLTYNGETAEKKFTVTVKRVTKITHRGPSKEGELLTAYTFTDAAIMYEWDSKVDKADLTYKSGAYYAFSDLNLSNHTFTARKTHKRINDGRWVEIGSAAYRQDYMGIIEAFKQLAQLTKKDSISLQDLKAAVSLAGFTFSEDKEKLFYGLQNTMGLVTGEYDAFVTLSPQAQTEMIKEQIDRYRKFMAVGYNLAETASWDEVLPAWKGDLENEMLRTEAKDTLSFKYRYTLTRTPGTDTYTFKASALYDSTKTWFNQCGKYKSDDGKIKLAVDNGYDSFGYNGKSYKIKLNAEGTHLEGKAYSSGQTVTAAIRDNRDGTISVTVEGVIYELSFSSYQI